MDDSTSAKAASASALHLFGSGLLLTSKMAYLATTKLLLVLSLLLSYLLWPVVLLGRVLGVLLLPLWLVASWSWHIFVVVPVQFLAGFEMLYVFLSSALLIGLATGVVLRFTTGFIVSLIPEISLPEGEEEEMEEGSVTKYETPEQQQQREHERQEARLQEAFSRAEKARYRLDRERAVAIGIAGSGSGTNDTKRKGSLDSKLSSAGSGKATASSSGAAAGSPTSGSNVLKQTILEEEDSSAEWDS